MVSIHRIQQHLAVTLLLVLLLLPACLPHLNGESEAAGVSPTEEEDMAVGNGTMDARTERRLRERWDAFMQLRTRPVTLVDSLSSPSVVHVVEGKDLYLTCGVSRPLTGRHRISFLRLSDLNLLSVGRKLHTPDDRIEVMHAEDEAPRIWTVRVRDARLADSGDYECQVNTSPATRRIFSVVVVRSSVSMEPPDPVSYLNVGSRLSLTCVVRAGPVLKPQFILWYRDDRIVGYADDGGTDDDSGRRVRTNVWTEEAPTANDTSANTDHSLSSLSLSPSYPRHLSRLVIEAVTESDSGEYRCDSDLTGEARTSIFVVREDLKSLHHGGPGGGEDAEPRSKASPAKDGSSVASSSRGDRGLPGALLLSLLLLLAVLPLPRSGCLRSVPLRGARS